MIASVLPREQTVRAADGRALHVIEDGDREGFPVLVHHGTPGAAEPFHRSWVDDADARGIRLIGYDRPGYGGSDADPGRSVADAAEDARTIADALGLERLATWGESGGGPHALACAALIPERLTAAAILCSPAPFDAEGLDWFAGQAQDNVDEHETALKGAEPLRRLLGPARQEMLAAEPEQMREGLGSLLSDVDSELVTGEVAAFLLAGIHNGLAPGLDGWVDDDLAFVSPWGFDPAQAGAVPVLLLHGVHDNFVPPSHARWLAERIPGVDAQVSDADGHLTLTMRRVPDVHAWLTEQR
jgi:pimeloyl-ACP methyl ester carboxylesterase